MRWVIFIINLFNKVLEIGFENKGRTESDLSSQFDEKPPNEFPKNNKKDFPLFMSNLYI